MLTILIVSYLFITDRREIKLKEYAIKNEEVLKIRNGIQLSMGMEI